MSLDRLTMSLRSGGYLPHVKGTYKINCFPNKLYCIAVFEQTISILFLYTSQFHFQIIKHLPELQLLWVCTCKHKLTCVPLNSLLLAPAHKRYFCSCQKRTRYITKYPRSNLSCQQQKHLLPVLLPVTSGTRKRC